MVWWLEKERDRKVAMCKCKVCVHGGDRTSTHKYLGQSQLGGSWQSRIHTQDRLLCRRWMMTLARDWSIGFCYAQIMDCFDILLIRGGICNCMALKALIREAYMSASAFVLCIVEARSMFHALDMCDVWRFTPIHISKCKLSNLKSLTPRHRFSDGHSCVKGLQDRLDRGECRGEYDRVWLRMRGFRYDYMTLMFSWQVGI